MGVKLNELLKVNNGAILRVFSLTAVSTLVKMLTGLISVKVVAILVGPSGIALLGQLNNFATIIMIVASGGINNGVTKYISEFKESATYIKELLSNGLMITILCSCITGALMIVFSKYLSLVIMQSVSYKYLFIIFGITISFNSVNALIGSILNGFQEFKMFVAVNIVGSVIGLLFTLSFVYFLGIKGALISAVTFQSMMFFISLFMVRNLSWLKQTNFQGRYNTQILKKYMKYSLMTLVTALTAPIAQLLLRGHVIANISSVEAGWWEAMNRISNMYLMVITTSFSVYYLPKLSELNNETDIRLEIFNAFKIIIPALLIGFVIVFFSRFIIIRILFSNDFIGMGKLFFWQLIGDFFKITSWLLAYLMIAKTMTKEFILSEIFFTVFYLLIAYILMRFNSVVGITQAYAINYIVYLITMIVLFRNIIFKISVPDA